MADTGTPLASVDPRMTDRLYSMLVRWLFPLIPMQLSLFLSKDSSKIWSWIRSTNYCSSVTGVPSLFLLNYTHKKG